MEIDHSHRPQHSSQWSVGLCDCGEIDTCCITCFLPCVTFGQIAEIVDEGQACTCVGHGVLYGLMMMVRCHWLYSCMYREKLRTKFGIRGDPCADCCVHFCCERCALCQEHAELKSRRFDPSKGWIEPTNISPPLKMPPTMIK